MGSGSQTVWIQIRPDSLSGLIWVQTICKSYQQTTKEKGKNIIEDVVLYVTGHIQIAQAPDRSEPDLNGEINYKYILHLLEDIGYDGFIGLEYKPRGKETGFEW